MDAEEIKEAMIERRGVYPDQLTREALRAAGCWEMVCVLPSDINDRIRFLANVMVQSISKSKVDDDKLRSIIGTLCQSLSYMMNSCSWREGKLHDFDEKEIQRKLKHFVQQEVV